LGLSRLLGMSRACLANSPLEFSDGPVFLENC
jgi:hypothetical protein